MGQTGRAAVGEADDRDLAGDGDARAEEGAERARGARAVEGQNGAGPGAGDAEDGHRGGAVLRGEPAGQDTDPVGRTGAAHGGAVGRDAVRIADLQDLVSTGAPQADEPRTRACAARRFGGVSTPSRQRTICTSFVTLTWSMSVARIVVFISQVPSMGRLTLLEAQ